MPRLADIPTILSQFTPEQIEEIPELKYLLDKLNAGEVNLNPMDTVTHHLLSGWDLSGPSYKTVWQELSTDPEDPEATRGQDTIGRLGNECWFYRLEGHGRKLVAMGFTRQSALDRALYLAETKRHE